MQSINRLQRGAAGGDCIGPEVMPCSYKRTLIPATSQLLQLTCTNAISQAISHCLPAAHKKPLQIHGVQPLAK